MTISQPTDGLPWVEYPRLSYGFGDRALLSLVAYVPGAGDITSVTAHFYPVGAPEGSEPALTLTDLKTDDTSWGAKTFYSLTPVKLPTLGQYRVAVEATGGNGTVHIDNVGLTAYQDIVQFQDFTVTGPAGGLDYDHRTVHLAGRLTFTDPRTGQNQPFPNTGITFGNLYDARLGGTVTDADGRFSVDRTVTGSIWADAEFNPSGTQASIYTSGAAQQSEPSIYASVEQTRVRFTTPTNVNLPVGGTGTVRGVVERNANGTWLPAPGVTYHFGNGYYSPNFQSGQGVTGADGSFSLVVKSPGTFGISTEAAPYLNPSSTDPAFTVHVPQADAVTGFSVTSDEYGQVKIHGHVRSTAAGYSFYSSGTYGVDVQYSADGRTWHTLGRTTVGRSGLADDEFLCWASWSTNSNGYWRVLFRGNADWRPAYSPVVHVSRTVTRVTGGKPNHTRVRKNATVRFTGSLQQYYSAHWHAFGGAKVRLVFRPKGSTTWYIMRTVKTDRYGHYTLSARAPMSGTWAVAYVWADSRHLDSWGPRTWVSAS